MGQKMIFLYFIDQRRQAARRDGCLCCIVHSNFKPEQTQRPSVLNKLFAKVIQYKALSGPEYYTFEFRQEHQFVVKPKVQGPKSKPLSQ